MALTVITVITVIDDIFQHIHDKNVQDYPEW